MTASEVLFGLDTSCGLPFASGLVGGSGFSNPAGTLCKKNISKKEPPNHRSLHCAPPDFLSRIVASR
jgi:hypothetical protein